MLPSIGNEVLKAVVAQYQAEQLLTQASRQPVPRVQAGRSRRAGSPGRHSFPGARRNLPLHSLLLSPRVPTLQRDQVSAAVRDSLMKRATEFNILVDDVVGGGRCAHLWCTCGVRGGAACCRGRCCCMQT